MLPASTKDTDGAAQPFPTTPIIDTVPLPLPPMSLTTTAALANTHSTSYKSDPDLSKTVYYSTPANPSHPLVQYTLMINAGSTGSRIHVYKFNNCGTSPTQEYEVFMMIQRGLSLFGDRPLAAAESLDPLMDKAVKVVPESLRKCTPVAIKATASLCLLGPLQSAEILKAVEC